jgi:hypothetical protein
MTVRSDGEGLGVVIVSDAATVFVFAVTVFSGRRPYADTPASIVTAERTATET